MKKHNKFKSLDFFQLKKIILNKRLKNEKYWKEDKKYNQLHKFDDETYEPGLKNYFWAISLDRIDIIEEHFRRGERKLNDNYDFRPAWDYIAELPLIRAIKAKSYRVMFFFLEHGADQDAFCLKTKMTPYQYAEQNNPRALKIFNDFKNGIKTKVKFKYQPKDKKLFPDNLKKEQNEEDFEYERGPLNFFKAIYLDRDDILKTHLETKESFKKLNGHFTYPMPPGFRFSLPLTEALKFRAYKALKCLVQHGADPNVLDLNIYMTPMQFAKENDSQAYQIIMDYFKETPTPEVVDK